MFSSISKIFWVTALGKLFGLVKVFLLVKLYGANLATDALIIAIGVYWAWGGIVVNSLFAITLIPQFAQIDSEKKQNCLALKTVQSINFTSLLVFLLLIASPSFIANIFVSGKMSYLTAQVGYALLLLSPLLFIVPIYEVFTILNQFHDRMVAASINLVVINGFQIGGIVYAYYHVNNVDVLYQSFALFSIGGFLLVACIQVFFAGYTTYFSTNHFLFVSYKRIWTIIASNYIYFFALGLTMINPYIDNYFISGLEEGSITVYNVIIKLPEAGQSLLITAISVVFFNEIVKKPSKIRQILRRVCVYIAPILCFALLLTHTFGIKILMYLYGEGTFEIVTYSEIYRVLMLISINCFLMVIISLYVKSAIVLKIPDALIIAAVLYVLVKIVGNMVLIRFYDIAGVAAATLGSSLIFIMYMVFRGKNYFRDEAAGVE